MSAGPAKRRRESTAQAGARGFIVIAVLWILAALSALVLIYLTFVTNTAMVVAGSTDRVQTEALIEAGVELAALQLTGRGEAMRPTSGTFNARLGSGRLFVTFRSEAARIDLNAASKDLIAGLMVGLGATPANAASYADRIIGWRMAASGEDDAENSFYRISGAPYLPRHAPFPLADELWLVRGIPSGFIERVLPFVTVFSSLAEVNVRDAAPQVLAALPNMTPERLQSLVSRRSDPALNPVALTGLAGEGATLSGSPAYRIDVEVESPNGRRNAAEIVILLLETGEEPYRVLSWRNAADGSPMAQRAASR